ncbi:MAG: DNA primase [Spirochaetales bacterium]|nr:DNA primase [Spirochaetales bacterium]
MKIPDDVLQQIVARADILSIIGNYTTLTEKGGRYWGLCPFHTEKTPSFSVQPDKGFFYCFGCHKGGSIFTFLMEVEKLSFVEAVETLGRQVGVEVSRGPGDSGEETRRHEALLELFRRVTGSFHYLFTKTQAGGAALAYLTGRGISRETIDAFQIGYAPADPFWLEGFLKKHGYSGDFLASSGLLRSGKTGRNWAFFSHRVIFPIFSAKGDIIAFGGRILEGDGPKYLNSSESPVFKKGTNLYGFFQAKDAIRREKTAIIVEGYMDVIALHQAGLKTAVAPLGTAFTADQARFLRRFADKLIFFFDGDAAGRKAALRSAEICEAFEFTLYAAALPSDKDPADFVQENRVEELQNLLKCPKTIIEYLLENYFEGASSAGSVLQAIFPYIRSIVSAVRREEALTRLAREFDEIDISVIRADFRRFMDGNRKKEIETSESEKKQSSMSMTPELLLIIASIDNKDDFSYIRSRLSLDDFTQAESRDVFITLEDMYRGESGKGDDFPKDAAEGKGTFLRESGNWNRDALVEGIENKTLREFIIEKLYSGELSENRKKMIQDAIHGIRRRNFEKKQRDVERSLRRLAPGNNGNEALIAELLEEKMYLDGELEKLRKMGNE